MDFSFFLHSANESEDSTKKEKIVTTQDIYFYVVHNLPPGSIRLYSVNRSSVSHLSDAIEDEGIVTASFAKQGYCSACYRNP